MTKRETETETERERDRKRQGGETVERERRKKRTEREIDRERDRQRGRDGDIETYGRGPTRPKFLLCISCLQHMKAGRTTFLSRFQPFSVISRLKSTKNV